MLEDLIKIIEDQMLVIEELQIPAHKSRWRGDRKTAYYEGLLEKCRTHGLDNLPFTPPHTRGSLITEAEAWILNTQRNFVPTLVSEKRWPVVSRWGDPETMTKDQSDWLSRNWGDGVRLWIAA